MPFINSDITASGANSPAIILAAVDTLTVGPDATLAATGTDAEVVRGGATSTVAGIFGQLFSLTGDAFSGVLLDLRVGATGVINSGTRAGVSVRRSTDPLNTIFGATIYNNGEISGAIGVADNQVGTDIRRLVINNSGLISGRVNGVFSRGQVEIVNAGTISGDTALNLSGAIANIENSGTISGTTTALNLVAGVTTIGGRHVLNTGSIFGDIALSAASDLFDSSLGRLNSIINANGGDDTVIASAGRDTVLGSTGDDVIAGLAGDDSINGGSGADDIDGGDGFDVATFSTSVYASLANPAQNTGEAAGDTYHSVEALRGSTFNDTLIGDAGDNFLDGQAGVDLLEGGAGDDRYVVDLGDTIIEAGGGGNDTAIVNANFALGDGVEVETLRVRGSVGRAVGGNEFVNRLIGGSGADTLSAGLANDFLFGNIGADDLSGGAGSDRLSGGADADRYIFDAALGANNVDRIVDFVSGVDRIVLENAVFTGLPTGPLASDTFLLIGAGGPISAEDRILYIRENGLLFFDADGSGGAFAAVLFATVDPFTTIVATDFSVI